MGLSDKIRNKLIKFLRIHEVPNCGFDVYRLLNYEENCAKNAIWYTGDSYELSQLFGEFLNDNNSFWGATQTAGNEIRKIHTGLPRLIVNTLAGITTADISDFEFENESNKELWDEIAKENDFKKLLKKATKNVLIYGDGAFKISFDEKISKLPIIEFYAGENVDYVYNRGRIQEIKFYNKYKSGENNYTLEETYGYGYIYYKLYNEQNEVDLSALDFTANLQNITFDNSVILAVPYMVYESETYQGRGASIFDGKNDAFDALDETISQWNDAVRAGRVKTYIPECLIPRDFEAGFTLKPNAFDNRFIKVGTDMSENAKNEITTIQPQIEVNSYLETYITFLDMALQGIISPSTLGIDVKKLDNAEAQREKEKTTLYTRQAIIDILIDVIDELVQAIFNSYNLQYGAQLEDVECEFSFGEYANPSFEAVVETMSNPNTPMSIEAKVDEIWGDDKDQDWKNEEVARIKAQMGIMITDEPNFAEDYEIPEDEEI